MRCLFRYKEKDVTIMEKFMKVYWAVVKFFAIFVAFEVLCIIALSTICNLIDGTNRTQYEHPAQPFKYNYSVDDTEYLLLGITQKEFVSKFADLLAQDTVAHYGISTFKHHVKSDVDSVAGNGRVLTETVTVEKSQVKQETKHQNNNLLLNDFPDVFIVDTTVHQSRIPSLGYRISEGLIPSDFDDNDIDTLSVGTFLFVENKTGPLCYCFSFFVPFDSVGAVNKYSHKCNFTDRGNKAYEGKFLMSVTVVDDQPLRLLLGRTQDSMVEKYIARHYLDRICQYDRQSTKNAFYSKLDDIMGSYFLSNYFYLIFIPSIPLLIILLLLGLLLQLIKRIVMRNQ